MLIGIVMFIKLKVHPGSRKAAITKKAEDSYEIWVREEAERGMANAAALHALSAELGIEEKRIMLVKGAHSPAKIVKIM